MVTHDSLRQSLLEQGLASEFWLKSYLVSDTSVTLTVMCTQ